MNHLYLMLFLLRLDMIMYRNSPEMEHSKLLILTEPTERVAPFSEHPGVDNTFEPEKSNEFQNVRIDRNSN
ncbi:MAG: hypothetical protein ACI8ZB_005010 [Desulforhopalus sp.]|jgi:hypothetical protein